MKRPSLALVVMSLLVAVITLRTPDTDRDEMRGKYSNRYSGFIDGESGLKVHYRDQGQQDGKPVIFLHGSSGSLHVFEPLIEQLGGGYRFIL